MTDIDLQESTGLSTNGSKSSLRKFVFANNAENQAHEPPESPPDSNPQQVINHLARPTTASASREADMKATWEARKSTRTMPSIKKDIARRVKSMILYRSASPRPKIAAMVDVRPLSSLESIPS